MGDQIEDVIAAIREDNPEQEVEVIDRGSYVRVQSDGRLRVTEETLRHHLGSDYEIRSFGTMMSSFAGRVVTTSTDIVWEKIKRDAPEGELVR